MTNDDLQFYAGISLLTIGIAAVLVLAVVYAIRAIKRARQGTGDDIRAVIAAVDAKQPLPAGFTDQMTKAMAGMGTAMQGFGESMKGMTAGFQALGTVLKRIKVSTLWDMVYIKLNWHDIWVGVYWSFDTYDGFDNMPDEGELDRLSIYICPLPCVVIRVDRVRSFVFVPLADPAIDPVCYDCGLPLSQHPVQNCNNLASGERTCTGNFKIIT